jgi:RNaseH domain of pPIWI_RE
VRSSGTVKTTNALLQFDETGEDRVFLLANVPRQYDGDGRHRRVGAEHSRWTAAQDEQPLNWYQHTATEVLVCGATEGPRKYGVAAARLCDHAISWDGRTQYPRPCTLPCRWTAITPNTGEPSSWKSKALRSARRN